MPRLTLKHMRGTRLPQALGLCSDNTPAIGSAINSAQQRLMFAKEVGDEGWFGSWARMVFNVLPATPYITLGRWGARLMNITVCKKPVAIQNDFFEFLEFGNGMQPKTNCAGASGCQLSQAYTRGDYPAFRDLSAPNRIIRVRALDPLDTLGTKRTLIQGTDAFDNTIYSQDAATRVLGTYLTLAPPFVDTTMTLNALTGIQKDVTNGAVQYWDVDPATGDETLLLTMEPGEEVSGYRRYFLNGLPVSCCPVVTDLTGAPTVQVEALVKLNIIPVVVDSDYLLLQNEEAIIAECQSARYSTMDLPSAKQMALSAHRDAIRLLQGELAHHYGTDKPAVGWYPFGSATLEKQAIGYLI